MKKLLILALLALFAISTAFAEIVPLVPGKTEGYNMLTSLYAPTSPRSLAMGGTGLGSAKSADAMFSNPAALANQNLAFSIPGLCVTVFHPQQILEKGIIDSFLNDDASKGALDFVKLVGTGYGKLASADASVAFQVGGFGLGAFVSDTLHTYSPKGTTCGLDATLIDELNATALLAYGTKIDLGIVSVGVGASVGFNYIAYNEKVTLDDFFDDGKLREDIDAVILNRPFMAGFSIPVNFGLNVDLAGLKLSGVVRNINGKTNMWTYEDARDILKSPMMGDTSFTFDNGARMDCGLSYSAKFGKLLSVAIEGEFQDVAGAIKNKVFDDRRDMMMHVHAGAELGLLNMFYVRGGLNQGYYSLGLGLDMAIIKVDAAYFVNEYGANAGTLPIDGLAIKLNLGF